MSIFSKKNKPTDKKEKLQKNDLKDEPVIELKEEPKTNKIEKNVDSVYPWFEDKKIEKPSSTDFIKEEIVDGPKWKHNEQKINTGTNLPKEELGLKVKEKKTEINWDKENKIEEPNPTDFIKEEKIEEPKWKHSEDKTEIKSEDKPIAKTTVEGLTVKENAKKEDSIFDKIKNENNLAEKPKHVEITKDNLISKPNSKEEIPSAKFTDQESDSLSRLKELAVKKESQRETSKIKAKTSGQKLEELLKKELNTPPQKNEKEIISKQTQNETKLDWLKNEVIEKPSADDFSFGDSENKKEQVWENKTAEATEIVPPADDFSWMKKEKIEEPTENDFATQTKEIVSGAKWKAQSQKPGVEVNHPKWIHEDGKTESENIIKTVREPSWKKDTVKIKRKSLSLKTPIDEIFELLESYKQADTAELAEYTKLDIFVVEKIMRAFEDYGIVEVRYPTTLGKKPTIILKKPVETNTIKIPQGKTLETYDLTVDFIPAKVSIVLVTDEARPIYNIEMPTIGKYTRKFLNYLKNEIAESLPMELDEITDPKKAKKLKEKFFAEAKKHLVTYFPANKTDLLDQLSGVVLHEMYGLGDLEVVMGDDMLEEVAINSAKTPVTVYHRVHGWLKTNLLPGTEEEIMNYASQIGRKIGREITTLSPILDAHLLSGDRVNATLFPISAEGNTLTIRRFARRPWTIIDFIGKAHTMNTDMAALLWLAMQYELNVVISGGTASGKTSALNTLLSLVPSYHRLISIEDVRELVLPKYLTWNWIPLITRSANPEGLGGVTMLDCMVSSLRMRPDRIIVGEIRRKKEAEVLMEAIETGHSIYSTIHANSAYQVLRRLAEQPMSIPAMQIELIDLIIVQYRDRKTNRRRTYEISEIEQTSTGKGLQVNTIYKWSPRTDNWEQLNKPTKLLTLLNLHTGLTEEDIEKELSTRKEILDWMRISNIADLNEIGFVMKMYYSDAQKVIQLAKNKTSREEIEKMME